MYISLVNGDAGTSYPESESEPGYFSRAEVAAIQNFAGSAITFPLVTLNNFRVLLTLLPVPTTQQDHDHAKNQVHLTKAIDDVAQIAGQLISSAHCRVVKKK